MSANTSVQVGKNSINLLQPALLPEQVLLTLPRVFTLWVLVLAFMCVWAVITTFQKEHLANKLATVQQANNQQSQKLEQLTTQLNNRKVSSELTERLETVKLLITNKQALHAKLTDPNETYTAGFAKAMQELSQMHRKDIRLQKIHINTEQMMFSGLALTPEAVPAWLAGFENSVLLSGKSFEHFKLSENDKHITQFVVSSKNTQEMLP